MLGTHFFFRGGGEGEEETLGLYRQGGRLGEKSWVCPNMRWGWGGDRVSVQTRGGAERERETIGPY